jgi:hypothetical protein
VKEDKTGRWKTPGGKGLLFFTVWYGHRENSSHTYSYGPNCRLFTIHLQCLSSQPFIEEIQRQRFFDDMARWGASESA